MVASEHMAAEIIKIDPVAPETAFSRAGDVIRSGGVIAYPTETFYGLGADPERPEAVKKIYRIKERSVDQPILLLIPDVRDVGKWTERVTPAAEVLMGRFWPGPLTLVFCARRNVSPGITAGTGKIGLRVPGNVMTISLLKAIGIALTGTSANISGHSSFRTAQEAAAKIGERVDLILDGGATTGGKPSTIIDVSEDRPKLLREGALLFNDVLARLGAVS